MPSRTIWLLWNNIVNPYIQILGRRNTATSLHFLQSNSRYFLRRLITLLFQLGTITLVHLQQLHKVVLS